jgi:hypothetical protein
MDAYRALCAEADADYEGFWAKRAREMITWKTRSPRRWMSPMLRSSSGLPMAS